MMTKLLIRLYRLVRPVLPLRMRLLIHHVRRRALGDSSQLGEALLIHDLIGKDWPRWLVDVGANDGITNSNTFALVRAGWNAILIEPNPVVATKLERNVQSFPNSRVVRKACARTRQIVTLDVFENDPAGMLSSVRIDSSRARGHSEPTVERSFEIEAVPLTTILVDSQVPTDFSLLSIDTEGLDFEVLKSLDPARYVPRIIVTETDENEVLEKQKRSLLQERGFKLKVGVGANTIWVHQTFVDQR